MDCWQEPNTRVAGLFFPYLTVENERICGEPAGDDSRYGPAHLNEMPSLIARENAEIRCKERHSIFSAIAAPAGYWARESFLAPESWRSLATAEVFGIVSI